MASKGNEIILEAKNVNVFYGDFKALDDISIAIPKNKIIGLIGPSGCGKSTFLRLFNRMNDYIESIKIEGKVFVDSKNIYKTNNLEINKLRKKVGMVFQKPNPFPKSIYENVAYGLRIRGEKRKSVLDDAVENALRRAFLFDEVKDKLKQNAFGISGGQQQRLCIARSLAVNPKILLMDEPTSALDPIATAKIEALIQELKKEVTIVIVTHNMQQAGRISDFAVFFHLGKLIEYNKTSKLFTKPANELTEKYITGRFG